MIVVPYLPAHLNAIITSPYQVELAHHDLSKHADYLATFGEAFTALDNGEVVGCGGLVSGGSGRADVWAIMGALTKGKMFAVTKVVRSFLDKKNKEYDRLDTIVKADFDLGKKWAEMLGFEYEATHTRFANGDDYYRYRRLANG